jgi:hypothetical protein
VPASTLKYTEALSKAARPEPLREASPPRADKAPESPAKSPVPVATVIAESEEEEAPGELDVLDPATIGSVMPPVNPGQIERFKKLLDKAVNDDVAILEPVLNVLIPSIRNSISVFRGQRDWETDLIAIIGRYADNLRPGFLKLMSAFNFDTWIIKFISQFCNFQEYTESFDPANVQQAHVFEFFTAILDMEPSPIERTDKILVLISSNGFLALMTSVSCKKRNKIWCL